MMIREERRDEMAQDDCVDHRSASSMIDSGYRSHI